MLHYIPLQNGHPLRQRNMGGLKLFLSVAFCAVSDLIVHGVVATGGLNGLPVLNGPIGTVSQIPGAKTRVGDFVHPGLWHTHDDLERIRNGVNHGLDPWKTAWTNFSKDSYSQATVSHQTLQVVKYFPGDLNTQGTSTICKGLTV